MTVGQRIKQRRKQLNMSAEELAAKIGRSPATMYRYEKGDIDKMDLSVLLPIADALLTTPAYLMGWSDDSSDYTALSELELRFITAIRYADPHDIDNALLILETSAAKKKEESNLA
jgi:transcriptional regulator with XRE-family HTH domain